MPVTNYIWDELSDNVRMEVDDAGTVTAQYMSEPGQFGQLISQRRNSTNSFYLFDAMGSTRLLTTDSQVVSDSYTYSAFGEPVFSTGSTTNPFRYYGMWGYYSDEETGEIYVRRRTYSPGLGRWLSVDPLGHVDGPNLYKAYFVPNGIDPRGEKSYDPNWLGNSGCFEYCMAAGNGYENCLYYCNHNSLPPDWPGELARPDWPICWGDEMPFEGWPPPDLEFQTGIEPCICRIGNCNLERPRGVNANNQPGPISTPGRGDALCTIGQKRIMRFEGICVSNPNLAVDCDCDGNRGACFVYLTYECTNNRGVNNWAETGESGNTKCE